VAQGQKPDRGPHYPGWTPAAMIANAGAFRVQTCPTTRQGSSDGSWAFVGHACLLFGGPAKMHRQRRRVGRAFWGA